MNRKKELFARISSAFASNLVSFAISSLIVVIVPKFISVNQYGYFQLYLFYVGYLGFLNFGWPEGILLKHGGKDYDLLNKSGLKTQFGLFSLLSVVVAGAAGVAAVLAKDGPKYQLWLGLGACILFALPGNFLQVLLHMTNRTHEYARGIVLEKVVYFSLVLVALLAGLREYYWLILADVAGRAVLLVHGLIMNRGMLAEPASPVRNEWPEIIENISIGIKLMLANLVGLFLIGIIRQCIELHWSVEVFAKVSLTLSISNMLMIFIRAVAIVLFPMLKNTSYDKLLNIYSRLRFSIMAVLMGMLVFYYPIREILIRWLPQYAESVRYVALLFPMCVFECRMSMLVETYMKTMRMERQMLGINVICVVLSGLLAYWTIFVMNILEAALLSIVVVVAVRCILAECMLTNRLNQSYTKDYVIETILVVAFIALNWGVGGSVGFAVYFALYALYLVIKRSELAAVVHSLRRHG